MGHEPRRILIEGWRGIPHSYCLWAMGLCAQFRGRNDVDVRWRDTPYPGTMWTSQEGVIADAGERWVRKIKAPEAGWQPSVVLRFDYPLRTHPHPQGSHSTPVYVVGTSEFGLTTPAYFADALAAEAAKADPRVRIITSSAWSAGGFVASGFAAERVHVVPLGVDPAVFCPLDDRERAALRARRWPAWCGPTGGAAEAVVFLHVSAMTPNKNLSDLLVAFASVANEHARARLVLKGLDRAYDSRGWFNDAVRELPRWQQEVIAQRCEYLGGAMTSAQMARLYQGADCLVMPYTAEGFCLPVLESAACGCPSICTAGGSTDDFTTTAFVKRIASDVSPGPVPGSRVLQPRLMDLIAQMKAVLSDASFRGRAGPQAAQHAHEKYSWARVAERFLDTIRTN